jgi:NADH-ubiquinone oxidoreductase chain 2
MLLSLSIYSIESIQAFIFYLVQYSLSNLNAFILLISIGYCLYFYVNKNEEYNNLLDKNNSPIQLISQIKGFFYINPILALSLTITLFSFVGVPPLIGFFAKQMVLSSAIDNGHIFMSIIAILTSVISAVYYLAIIKQVFFDKSDYIINPILNKNYDIYNNLYTINNKNITLSSSLSIIISILTFIILLFMFFPQE